MGTVRATYLNGLTTISISLINQTPGTIRSIHLYDGTCEDSGDIWNMNSDKKYCDEDSNGSKWFKPNIGDIGNVVVNNEGIGEFELTTDLWTINSGLENDILGKVVILHAGPENFLEECDPNHIPDHFHPNTKIACGSLD